MERIVGIDLGTTNSLVAYLDGDTPRVIADPATGRVIVPSVVTFGADAQPGEPVGAILRDLRARYDDRSETPVPTFLAYVYYGHPRLTLHRAP